MYRCLSHRLDGVYNHPRREIVGREVLLKKEIKTATEEKQFVLHYQPQIEIASGRLVGVEALLCWQHPSLGTLTPASFESSRIPSRCWLSVSSGVLLQFSVVAGGLCEIRNQS